MPNKSSVDRQVAGGHRAPHGAQNFLRPSWSAPMVMGSIFFASWTVQSIAGWATYNEQQLQRLQDPLRWSQYVLGSDFWSRTLQNWQSEFLAVGSMAVLSIYLCQRGSPESKPVGAAHSSTGVEG